MCPKGVNRPIGALRYVRVVLIDGVFFSSFFSPVFFKETISKNSAQRERYSRDFWCTCPPGKPETYTYTVA